jgi:hypothetical protein
MRKIGFFVLGVWVSVQLTGAAQSATNNPAAPPSGDARPPESISPADTEERLPLWSLDRWSFQGGVAWISKTTIDEIALLQGERADGDASGEIHLLQVSYKAAELHPTIFGQKVDVDFELPLVLGVVDEDKGDPFLQTSFGITFRWKSFPWNRWLYTNFETGGGFTYSGRVLETERMRHPGRERSHVEFYWPVQLMLAHPKHRAHQFVLFLHHHSGGAIFHKGGANSLGLGYRFVPGERGE